MASNRYGIIEHANCVHTCEIRFGSPQARDAFAEKFETYHASHDHDGEPPTFQNAAASDIDTYNGFNLNDAGEVTVDGWAKHQIRKYHENTDRTYVDYEPPTCCVPPLLSFDSFGDPFMPSDAFQRHELSAIFGDMPDPDYTSLLESVERDGFIENVIKLLDGEILDGWHRYRAAKELNLLRKLRFQQYKTDDEGDPAVFVLARNIERRHYDSSQRAQVVVEFNERFGHGGDRASHQNGDLKTRKELAKEAGVGTSTIDRAVAIKKAGQSEAVIAGEKTASEVLLEENRKKAHARAERERRALWAAYNNDERFGDEDDPEGFVIAASKAIGVSEMEGRFIYEAGKDEIDELSLETAETWGQRFRQIRRDIEAGVAWVVAYQAGSTKRDLYARAKPTPTEPEHPDKPIDAFTDEEFDTYFDEIECDEKLSNASTEFYESWAESRKETGFLFDQVLDAVSVQCQCDRSILGEIASNEYVRKSLSQSQRDRYAEILLQASHDLKNKAVWVKGVSEDEGSDAESGDKVITRIMVFYDDPNSKERPSERHIEFSEGPVADKKLDALPLMVRTLLAKEIKDV